VEQIFDWSVTWNTKNCISVISISTDRDCRQRLNPSASHSQRRSVHLQSTFHSPVSTETTRRSSAYPLKLLPASLQSISGYWYRFCRLSHLSVRPSVRLSVCLSGPSGVLWKTAAWILMLFAVMGRLGLRMRQVDGVQISPRQGVILGVTPIPRSLLSLRSTNFALLYCLCFLISIYGTSYIHSI